MSFKGLHTALVTPFNENLEIDLNSYRKLMQFQADNKVDGLLTGGTTGENPTFADFEYDLLFDETSSFCKDHKMVAIAGCGSNSTQRAIELTQRAAKYKMDYALVITPYYNKPNQAALLAHFRKIADRSLVPIIMYNVPSRTAVDMSVETILELAEHENIVSIKEASGSVAKIQNIAFNTDKISIISGEDELNYAIMATGGVGAISVASNIIPLTISNLINAMLGKDFDLGIKLAKESLEICQKMFIDTNPIPVKYALSLMGICQDKLRLPLVGLSQDKKIEIQKLLRKNKIIS